MANGDEVAMTQVENCSRCYYYKSTTYIDGCFLTDKRGELSVKKMDTTLASHMRERDSEGAQKEEEVKQRRKKKFTSFPSSLTGKRRVSPS